MARFDLRARLLVKHGVRLTTKRKIISLMGRFAASKTHFAVAKSVLKGHLTFTAPYLSLRQGRQSKEKDEKSRPLPPVSPPPRRDSLVAGSGNRQKRSVLASLGISPETCEADLGRAASLFLKRDCLVENKSRATSLAKAKLIQRYIDYCRMVLGSRKDEISNLLCEKSPLEFMNSLQAVFKPNTRRNHANAMVSLFECALYDPKLRDIFGSSPFMKTRLTAVKEVWSQLKRKDSKAARDQQRLKIRNEEFRNAPVMEILNFLRDSSVKVEECMKDWDSHVSAPSPDQLRLVQSYVATVLSLHGQRLCAALELTASEVLSATEFLGRFVIRIKRHKTARYHGPAAVCLRALHYRVFKRLAEFRSSRGGAAAGATKLLEAPQGRAGRFLFSPLDDYIRMKNTDFPGMSFNLVRRTLESNSHLAVTGSTDRSRADMNQYLNHGRGVSELYYRFRNDDHIASEAKVVESVLSQLIALDMARQHQLELPSTWRDPFPSADQLLRVLGARWTYHRHLAPPSDLSTTTYDCIQSFWRDDMRPQILSHFAHQPSELCIRNIPTVWIAEYDLIKTLVSEMSV